MSTGETLRHIETPIIPTPAPNRPTTNGAIAPADNGIAAINSIQNFFIHFMLFIIPQIIVNVI